jgi:CheY-like chemotaxis protein
MSTSGNNRILIVDDNRSIHEDFLKVLPTQVDDEEDFDSLLDEVFGEDAASLVNGGQSGSVPSYRISHAYQGEEGYKMVQAAAAENDPFSLIFMDVRMPPGWDGIETTKRIWETSPYTEVAVCTAYSDYSWEDILQELGSRDQLQFIRKPFDVVTVKQMALAMTQKWGLARLSRHYTEELKREVAEQTRELQEKLDEITQLRGILPMCSYCKRIRTDQDYWLQVDDYIRSHTLADVSHGICPECYQKLIQEMD